MPHAWDGDEALLEDLRDALMGPSEEVPREFIEAAKAAFTWRTIDAELLMLTSYDSVLDDDLFALARSTMTARQLVFEGEVSLQVEVGELGITGQLVPPRAARVMLMTPDGSGEEVATDELGCFLMGPPPRGPVRFRIDDSVFTDWVVL